MEFNFNINNYFKNEITKIGSRLIPEGFIGDRREVQECITRMSLVLTILGENSAKAQGLQKVITSGERLRNSDHVVYILVDPKGGSKGQGAVLGMLKMGTKHLYVFDAGGNNHEVYALSVLDFYIHESKQRMGLGKKLFQHMLKEEKVEPQHLAIDKPSPKFLSFLHKHYGLETIIPQMNNFVVFDGFFVNRQSGEKSDNRDKILPAGVSSCASRYSSSGAFPAFASTPVYQPPEPQPKIRSGLGTHYGRPAPHKPVSTLGMILQQKPAPTQQPSQPGSNKKESITETEPENDGEKNNDNAEIEEKAEEQTNAETEALTEDKVEVEEDKIDASVAEEVTEALPASETSSTAATPLRCNTQAGTAPHLDLKFYHSSLW